MFGTWLIIIVIAAATLNSAIIPENEQIHPATIIPECLKTLDVSKQGGSLLYNPLQTDLSKNRITMQEICSSLETIVRDYRYFVYEEGEISWLNVWDEPYVFHCEKKIKPTECSSDIQLQKAIA